MTNLRILIIRIDRIGDVVLATPLPREIKHAFPDAYVSVLVRQYTKDIFLNNPFVDDILVLEDYPGLIELAKVIRSKEINFSFMLLPNEKVNWALFLAGVKNRVGVGDKFYQFITNAKSVFRRKYLDGRHESEYCMDMLRKLGVKPKSLEPEIYLSEEEVKLIDKIRASFNGKIPVGINSTSGNSAPNLPVAEYKVIINELLKDNKIQIVVTDLVPPKEITNIDEVLYPNIDMSLRESIVNFSALDYLISASTGPMHIAAALGVSTIALFCPLPACSPNLWGPRGNRSDIILPDENYCHVNCPGDPKNCKFEGEGGIDSNKVLSHLYNFMSTK